jgi:DNA-binding CsgD family transcriptional regulator
MQHLYVFYFFITVSIGIVSLAIAVDAYIKTGDKLLKYYLYFYSAFTLDVMFTAWHLYISTNIPSLNLDILLLISYGATVAYYLLIFAITVFTHVLWIVPHSRIKNIIFGGIIVVLYIGQHYFVFVTDNRQLQRIGEYIETGVFISVVLYAFVVGIYYYGRLQENVRKAIALRVLILLGIFIPGFVYEIFSTNDFSVFSPLLYCGFSILFTYYLITQYPSHLQASKRPISEEEFFDAYQISPREREIAAFLLRGYKNQHIAETLCISVTTVKTHIRNMYPKFGVTSRYELLVLFNDKHSSTPEAEHSTSVN